MGADKSSSRPRRRPMVWSEAGVTIAVTDSPPQFVRFSFGAEMQARGSSKKDLDEAEAKLFAYCEGVVAERSEELAEMVLETWEERRAELNERLAEQPDYPYS